MRRVEDTAISFGRACDEAAIPYALIGGLAVIAWGQPRTTADVDALLILRDEDVARFCDSLRKGSLDVGERDLRDAIADRSHVTIFDPLTRFHVDARTARDAAEAAQIRSAIPVDFKGALLRISRPEETIAFKLKYASEQDLQDAASILVRQDGRLDLARLHVLASQLGVTAALERLIGETQ